MFFFVQDAGAGWVRGLRRGEVTQSAWNHWDSAGSHWPYLLLAV